MRRERGESKLRQQSAEAMNFQARAQHCSYLCSYLFFVHEWVCGSCRSERQWSDAGEKHANADSIHDETDLSISPSQLLWVALQVVMRSACQPG